MKTALDLFAKEGYGHVTIAMLADNAGISRGLMYNYFESKDQLLKELLNNAIEYIMESFDPNQDGILTPDEFELFIRKTFKLMRDEGDFFRKFFSMIIQPNVKLLLRDSAMKDLMIEYFEVFTAYFKKQGFEDPPLEVFNLSVLIEGFGIMMLFYDDISQIPESLFKKFEERIIEKYT